MDLRWIRVRFCLARQRISQLSYFVSKIHSKPVHALDELAKWDHKTN